jgi:hypothetical protein
MQPRPSVLLCLPTPWRYDLHFHLTLKAHRTASSHGIAHLASKLQRQEDLFECYVCLMRRRASSERLSSTSGRSRQAKGDLSANAAAHMSWLPPAKLYAQHKLLRFVALGPGREGHDVLVFELDGFSGQGPRRLVLEVVAGDDAARSGETVLARPVGLTSTGRGIPCRKSGRWARSGVPKNGANASCRQSASPCARAGACGACRAARGRRTASTCLPKQE